MNKPLTIAVAGLGTVGTGVVRLLADNAAALERRCGRSLKLVAVSARDKKRKRGIDLAGVKWFDDPVAMAKAKGIDVVVELIGQKKREKVAMVAIVHDDEIRHLIADRIVDVTSFAAAA